MNRFIARIYSEALEIIHALFVLGLITFTIYVWGSEDSRLTVWQVVLVYVSAFGTWIVVFGFITTIVVMAKTLTEIKEQNRALVVYLERIADATLNVKPESRLPTRPTRSSNEPFIGSGTARK